MKNYRIQNGCNNCKFMSILKLYEVHCTHTSKPQTVQEYLNVNNLENTSHRNKNKIAEHRQKWFATNRVDLSGICDYWDPESLGTPKNGRESRGKGDRNPQHTGRTGRRK